MFEKLFRRKIGEEIKPKLTGIIDSQPVKEQKLEFKIEDFSVSGDKQRMIIHIPKEIFRAVGGQDVLTRNIFPAIFDGSYPIWSENYNNEYAIEIPHDKEKIEEFKKEILTRISKQLNT